MLKVIYFDVLFVVVVSGAFYGVGDVASRF